MLIDLKKKENYDILKQYKKVVIHMSKENKLYTFTIPELKVFRQEVKSVKSKQELLMLIDETICQKEYVATQSLNARFPVDWFNIDRDYIELLHRNGIDNLQQLREIPEENLYQLTGMTKGGYSQISWARDFFDMTPLESLTPEQRTRKNIVKEIVKHANECSKKHPNI